MATKGSDVQERLQELNDLELAILVALVAQEHCVFSSDEPSKALQYELGAVCSRSFGRQVATIHCTPETTVDELNEAVLVNVDDVFENAIDGHASSGRPPLATRMSSAGGSPRPARFGSSTNGLDDRRIADVVIATDLDLASENVQVQVIEMLRTRRIFTRTSMHSAPKDFLFVSIMSQPGARLSHHLNDCFSMSHFHISSDGLPYTDNEMPTNSSPALVSDDITHLRLKADQTMLAAEVAAYLHNIVLFMRMSRYVNSGVTAEATKQLRTLSKALAPLHGLDFVPPSLVVLAARKVYPHRLVLATPETERSIQWGSSPEAVRKMLEGVTVEDAIEDAIASVETPL